MKKIYHDLYYNVFQVDYLIEEQINEEDYKKVNDITLERFTYDFFQYFPGIRNYYMKYSELRPEKREIIHYLDSVLEEVGFNLLKTRPCYELKKQGNFQPLLDLIWPIYKKMIARGYKKEELFHGFRNIYNSA